MTFRVTLSLIAQHSQASFAAKRPGILAWLLGFSGHAHAWGARGRVFESLRPDQINEKAQALSGLGLFRFWAPIKIQAKSDDDPA